MIRRNRGGNAKVEAKKDVVKSRTISVNRVVGATVVILAAFLVFGVPDALSEATEAVAEVVTTEQPEVVDQAVLKSLYNKSGSYKRLAHLYRHKRGGGHAYHRPLSPMTQSVKYEQYRVRMWASIAKKERLALKNWRKAKLLEARRFAAANRDMHKALRLASKHYGVSYSWLHACAHSEGHIDGRREPGGPIDPFIMNHGGSGAGGWMQFMESTFYGNIRGANPIPRKYRKWNSKLGQAYVAAYMFKIGQSRQWTGPGCN